MFVCMLKFREVHLRAKIIHECKGSLKGEKMKRSNIELKGNKKYKFLKICNRHKI